jgi:2'-5' RNA ligase
MGLFSRAALRPPCELAVVALLSDEAHNYVRALQRSLAREFGIELDLTATPHITLKLGFPTADLDPFASYLDHLLQDVDPFDICLTGFDAFPEGIVFMDVARNAPLEALRRRVVADLAERHKVPPYPLEGDAYRLHVTLASDLSRRDLQRMREHLDHERAEFRFELRALGLLCHTRGRWVTYRRGTLSRQACAAPARAGRADAGPGESGP